MKTLPCNSNQQPNSARKPAAITPAASAHWTISCFERFGQPGHHAVVLSKMKIIFNRMQVSNGHRRTTRHRPTPTGRHVGQVGHATIGSVGAGRTDAALKLAARPAGPGINIFSTLDRLAQLAISRSTIQRADRPAADGQFTPAIRLYLHPSFPQLGIAKALVEAHGGHISASSQGLGAGQTFTIALPLRAASPPRTSTPPPGSPISRITTSGSKSHATVTATGPLSTMRVAKCSRVR